MLDADVFLSKNDSDDVEPEGVARLLEPRHPDFRGPAELTLLAPVDGAHGAAEIRGPTGLHLHERDRSAYPSWVRSDRHKIDVAVPVPESSLRHLPPVDVKPLLGYALSRQSHRLSRR